MFALRDVRTGVRPHSMHPLKCSATKLGCWTHCLLLDVRTCIRHPPASAHPYFCPDGMRPEASVGTGAIIVRMRIRHPHQLSGVLIYVVQCSTHLYRRIHVDTSPPTFKMQLTHSVI